MTKRQGPKVLTIDIETAPNLGYFWGTFKQFIGQEFILEDWSILSFAAKWLHRRNVIYRDTFKLRNKRNDRALVLELWNLLDEADIVIGQNARRFDVKKINSRFLKYGLPPPSPYKIVDTLEVSKRYFAHTSNRLGFVSDRFCTKTKKRAHKQFPGNELWVEYLKGNKKAQREMALYNPDDVLVTEELYLLYLPWITSHPNFGNYVDSETPVCNRCGSDDIKKNGTYHTDVGQYQKYRCNSCGGSLRGRELINSKRKRKSLLMGV